MLECLTPSQCFVLMLPSVECTEMIVFLHGLGDTAEQFAKSSIVKTVKAQMDAGDIPPAIILIPEGQRGYWIDWTDMTHQYASWTMGSILAIHQLYDIEHTALVGVSMGGFGALNLGLRHPEYFDFVMAYSPTDLEIALEERPDYEVYTNIFGADLYSEYAWSLNPRELILRGAGKEQEILWAVGDAEPNKFWLGSQRLEQVAQTQGLAPKIRVVHNGEHSFLNTWSQPTTLWWLEHWSQMNRAD